MNFGNIKYLGGKKYLSKKYYNTVSVEALEIVVLEEHVSCITQVNTEFNEEEETVKLIDVGTTYLDTMTSYIDELMELLVKNEYELHYVLPYDSCFRKRYYFAKKDKPLAGYPRRVALNKLYEEEVKKFSQIDK